MSTKITLYYDENVHFYQECFDEKNVYLEFSSGEVEIELKFSLEQILGLVKRFDLSKLKKQTEITDKSIEEYVENRKIQDDVIILEDLNIERLINLRDNLIKILNKKTKGTDFFFGLEMI